MSIDKMFKQTRKDDVKGYADGGKLGSGARFKAVEASAAASGARNPAGVAAAAGIKKYGQKKMTAMAQAGKRRANRGK
jgi:hypothetical protein